MIKPLHPKSITGQVLIFLAHTDGKWATWGPSMYMPTVQSIFRIGTTETAQFRFMKRLQFLGLVGGCDCGCRGDYALTFKGLMFLCKESVMGEQEAIRWKEQRFTFGY